MKIAGKTYHAAEVLAGAYRGKALEERALLIHLAEVDERESVVRALCRGVKAESLITDSGDIEREPTCPACIERVAKLRAKQA